VLVQNAYQDGYWLEWGGAESDTGSGTQTDSAGLILFSDYNGGNGFTLKGVTGALANISQLVAHNNGGWGLQTSTSLAVNTLNTYLNTSGGCDVQSPSGTLTATNASCDTATGWGLLQEATAGQVVISGGFIAGGTPIELRSGSGGVINAVVANPAAATTCLKFNGGGNFIINALFLSCATNFITFTSESAPNFITGTSPAVPGATFSGTPSSGDYVNIYNPAGLSSRYFQIPTAIITSLGYTPSLPTSSGTLLASGQTDPHIQQQTVGGCTTPGVAGSPCVAPITVTWTTSFANASYFPVCTGITVTAGSPGAVYVVSQLAGSMVINYPAITAAAASYNNVTCWAVHN